MAAFQLTVHEHIEDKLKRPKLYMATYNGEGPMWGGLENLLRNTKELMATKLYF